MVNRSSSVPPWEQLALILRTRIESGELQPGGRIPSVINLAQEYDLAAGTVRKALGQLQKEGLIESRVGWGTFVSKAPWSLLDSFQSRGMPRMEDGIVDVVNLDRNTHWGYFGDRLVASIAAAAGLDVMLSRLGRRIDLQVFKPGPSGTSSSRQVTLQAKPWPKAVSSDGNFHYPLKVTAFNCLAGSDRDLVRT
jgi:GntR family transcriptional regulator